MLIIKLAQHEKINEVTTVCGTTRRILFSKVWRRHLLVTYKTDAPLFKINTSRWFKYFTGWDVYDSWDSSQYRQNNSEEGKWRNHIFMYFFLKPEKIGDCFVEDFNGTMPSGEEYQQFADYLTEKYIDSNALFPPKLWASRSWQKMSASLFTDTNNIKIWFT